MDPVSLPYAASRIYLMKPDIFCARGFNSTEVKIKRPATELVTSLLRNHLCDFIYSIFLGLATDSARSFICFSNSEALSFEIPVCRRSS